MSVCGKAGQIMRKQIGQRQDASFQGERIAVTGVGIVSALGQSVPAVWDALLAGAHGIDRIVGFDPGGFDCQQAAQARDLNPQELGIHSKDARIMDKLAHMLIKCGLDAIKESGLHETSLPREEYLQFLKGQYLPGFHYMKLIQDTILRHMLLFLFLLYAMYHYYLGSMVDIKGFHHGNIQNLFNFYIKICGVFWILIEWTVGLIGLKIFFLLKRRT